MRDLDRWKDKVELQLDGRQIFLLFFGSAICACLIFVLGVVIGKRVEARAAAQAHSGMEDPLAALDELGSTEEGLTFHSALAERSAAAAHRPDVKQAEAKPEAKQEGKPEAKPEAKIDPDTEGPKLAESEKGEKADRPHAKATETKAPAKEARAESKEAKPEPKPEPKIDAKPEADAKVKSHFTLQLSAFATKGEATDFMHKLHEAGYRPFIIESMVPGKGLMYRVRLGDFTSRDSALTAKSDFEKKHKMVAYVAKL